MEAMWKDGQRDGEWEREVCVCRKVVTGHDISNTEGEGQSVLYIHVATWNLRLCARRLLL